MKRIFILIMLMLCFTSVACSGDRTIKHYGRDGSRTGYTKVEGNRASHFSKDGERTGYLLCVKKNPNKILKRG